MIHNAAVPIPQAILDPIGVFPAPKQPTGSILARICALEAVSEHLSQANASQAGKTFHIFNQQGALLRRGVVVKETLRAYVVYFCDVFGILSAKPRRVPKSDTTHWHWFDGVEESNAAYRKHFHIYEEPTPSPSFVWDDRSLEQVYLQEAN